MLCAIGTVLLLLPGMRADGRSVNLSTALFISVSASCVTGLTTVDTATYWSPLGQFTIMVLIQVGGFGIQALGTLWIIVLNRRLRANSRMAAQAETGVLTQGDVRTVLKGLAVITIVVESTIAVLLALRLIWAYDAGIGQAAWLGMFHSVSAFNNAGFALASDSLMTYGADPWILAPISLAIILGGLGFLVILELFNRATRAEGLLDLLRPKPPVTTDVTVRAKALAQRSRYRVGALHPERLGFANPIPLSLHTRMMLFGTALVMAVGALGFAVLEWGNPSTIGQMPWGQKLMQAWFSGGITPRTAGFNTVDYAQVHPATRFMTDAMMFIGGGSGSTAGGIKVTTLLVLGAAMMAEIRGNAEVNVRDRRIPDTAVRVAIAVVMISFTALMVGTLTMMAMTGLPLDLALFEVGSGLATVGLSANITPTLPQKAQFLLIVLMLLGKIGPLTLASSLTLRNERSPYRLPEGRPMIG